MTERKMPRQKPGKSKQDYCTPQEFLDSVAERFGRLAFDLAADRETVIQGAKGYFAPGPQTADPRCKGVDSLNQDWSKLRGNLWLNPPFALVSPWAAKCHEQRRERRWTLLLVPASTGALWFTEYCLHGGYVSWLRPRLSFDGQNAYPKDLVLVAYGFGVQGSAPWRWR